MLARGNIAVEEVSYVGSDLEGRCAGPFYTLLAAGSLAVPRLRVHAVQGKRCRRWCRHDCSAAAS